MPTKRDYYEVLGLKKGATAAEIKASYRKMALQFHPDRNKEKDAESKFKEINEAYQVLSDDKKRQTYDQFGHAAFDPAAGGAAGIHLRVDFEVAEQVDHSLIHIVQMVGKSL